VFIGKFLAGLFDPQLKLFAEEWLASLGYDVKIDQMNDWRRAHVSNLLNAFDFDNVSSLPNSI
jgi:hypothetical protein